MAGLGASLAIPDKAKAGLIIDPYKYGGASVKTLIEHLTDLSLLTNLRVCLDASDILSSPASSTKWLDRSGNGDDFFLGSTVSAETADPTFNGTPGTLNPPCYYNLVENTGSGAERFTYDTTNPAWINDLHKANEVWTVVGWFKPSDINNRANPIMGTTATFNGDSGVAVLLRNNGDPMGVFIMGPSGTSGVIAHVQSTPGTVTVGPNGTWCFAAVTQSAVSNQVTFVVNGNSEVVGYTPSGTRSASNATRPLNLGAIFDPGLVLPHNGDIGAMAIWDRVLSVAELSSLYEATRTRFGV